MCRRYGEELAGELIGKAVTWGCAVAGGFLLSPAGIAVGAAARVVIACPGSSGDRSESGASQENATGSSN